MGILVAQCRFSFSDCRFYITTSNVGRRLPLDSVSGDVLYALI
jgi:hypothetical protein